MTRLWTRLRGALGLGVLWGLGGAAVGGAIEVILNILPGSDLLLGVDMWPAVLAIPGFLAGLAFALVLWIMEGRRSFADLRLPRVAGWGALGGAALGAVVGLPLVAVAVLAGTSAVLAAGSLALARRAERSEIGAGPGSSRAELSRPDDPA